MSYTLSFLLLVIIHFVFGKKVSFPWGAAAGIAPHWIGLTASVCDIALIFVVMFIFEIAGKFKYIRKLKERQHTKAQKWLGKKRYKYFRRLGKLGIVGAVAVPFTGGVYTAALIAETLQIKRRKAIALAMAGMVIGNGIFTLAFMGVIQLTF